MVKPESAQSNHRRRKQIYCTGENSENVLPLLFQLCRVPQGKVKLTIFNVFVLLSGCRG